MISHHKVTYQSLDNISDAFPKHLHLFRIKDPGSSITHFIGMIAAMIAALPLLSKAATAAVVHGNPAYLYSMFIFITSMILLYAASTTYHTFDINDRVNTVLKKIDHMMICVLIAGSYTPICLLVIPGRTGILMLLLVWSIALIEMLVKLFFVFCPKWVSSILYIGMGWLCVFQFETIWTNLSSGAFGWLLAGGIIYTIGGVLYALKLKCFQHLPKNFGSHEIFHLFVMGGSFCHFIVMYTYLLA